MKQRELKEVRDKLSHIEELSEEKQKEVMRRLKELKMK